MKRSRDLDELNMNLFSAAEQKKIEMLISQPKAFYKKYVIDAEKPKKTASKESAAEKRLKEIENSTTYMVGKIVMFLPIAVKKAVKKLLKG